MVKYFVAAISAVFLMAVNLPANSETAGIPAERSFPSTVGEVTFKHQTHIQERAIACVECHHQINANKLKSPHPDFFKKSSINCELCHNKAEETKQRAYACSGCHRSNPKNIADETLSAKVVIHQQCWKCHPMSTGKEASAGCEKCHSGKKTF